MTTLTEGAHTGEWLLWEAPNSRVQVVVASGQNLADGQLVQLSSGKVVAKDTNVSSGLPTTRVEGILFGAVNASGGDKAGVIISNDAEVKEDLLTFPAGDSPKAACKLGLRQQNHIQVRDTLTDIPSI